MIEQQATVISEDDTSLIVHAERESTCSKCQVRQGCGTGLLAEHVGKRFSRISVEKTPHAKVGDNVTLGIPEDALLKGTFMVYIGPLLTMFAGSGLANILNLHQVLEIIFGFSGLLIGFYWAKARLNQTTQNLKAKIIEDKK